MKKFSNEKGAITLFVIVAMLFMLIAFINIYFIASNRAQTQAELARQTEGLYLKDVGMANDIYNSYFAGDVIPIYTVAQLLKIGSGDYIVINEEEKIYHFTPNATYVLKNDLEFDFDIANPWIPIGTQYEENPLFTGRFEGNGRTILVSGNSIWGSMYEFNMGNGYRYAILESRRAEPGVIATGENKVWEIDGKTAMVPIGFMVSEKPNEQSIDNGLVIIDVNGNEFVWVPCTIEGADGTVPYEKWDGSITEVSHTDARDDGIPATVTNWGQTESSQITKYRGFYIARYEAGLPTNITQNVASAATRNVFGVPLSKKNAVPWNYIDYATAKSNAQKMYAESYLQSGLVTGKMWDTVCKWLETSYNVQTNSSGWGNYTDAPVTNVIEYSTNNGATWLTKPSGSKGISTAWLLKTGHSEYTKAKNIYDLAGNLEEFTAEIKGYTVNRIFRGGYFYSGSGITDPAARRGAGGSASFAYGFRVVLYIR